MYDLVFIGGGLSCGLTLAHLFESLGQDPDRSARHPLRLLMIDRDGEFGAGRAYGRRAHPGLLLNETVATMETCGFSGWLAERREAWLSPLEASDDPAVAAWRHSHFMRLKAVDTRRLAPLYLPRATFGQFARERIALRIEAARRAGQATTELMTAEVRSVERADEATISVDLADGRRLATRIAVVGLGSPTTSLAPELRGTDGYTDDLPRDREHLRGGPAGLSARQVVIIGGNAAAMEAVHALRYDAALLPATVSITVVAPNGRLPDGEPSGRKPPPDTLRLRRLARTADAVTASALLEAARCDAEHARVNGYTSLDYAPSIVRAFSPLFERLSDSEQWKFVETCGHAFTALCRRAPPDYAASARHLASQERMRVIAGRVTAIARGADSRSTVALAGTPKPLKADLVVDASGTRRPDPARDPLLRNLLRAGGAARLNGAGLGLEVSGTLEASPGVFVIGPLLAGHCGEAGPIWNLESAPRIDLLARRLAATLRKRL